MLDNHNPRELAESAQGYARNGWLIFPLHAVHDGNCSCGKDHCSSAGKHPRTKNGVKDATTDARQIARWWEQWPQANIGIATGSGLYVIDVDCAKGGTLASLEELGIAGLAWTLTARTGSGGYHLYLRCTGPLGNTAGKLAPYVDTRGDGGYVVAPPSRNKHGAYSWYDHTCEIQDIPEKLLARLKGTKSSFAGTSALDLGTTKELEKQAYDEHSQAAQSTQACLLPVTSPAIPHQPTPEAPSSGLAQEARNDFLIRQAGTLRADGFCAAEIRDMIRALNECRYGAGRHPQGPLAQEELERTIFKSVTKWEQEGGVLAPAHAEVQSLSALLKMDLPPVAWIVPDLLSEGLTLLAGKPKTGKSWLILGLALGCALGCANGDPLVLGRYRANPMGVLYLSLEDSPTRLRDRTLKILGTRQLPDTFGYALRWKPLQAGGLQDLEAVLLAAPDTRLVIIDTLAKVRQPTTSNGNSYQEDSALMAQLQLLANQHHLALVIVHHLRKMGSDDVFDEVSGTLGLTGGADTTIVLKRPRYQNDGTLAITGRDVAEENLIAIFSPSTGLWSITGKVEEGEQKQVNQSRQEILDLLREKGEMKPSEITKALGKAGSTIRSLLVRMNQGKILEKREDGSYMLVIPQQAAPAEEDLFEAEEDL
jgi:DNA-binding transcriptional ArsR family regulator